MKVFLHCQYCNWKDTRTIYGKMDGFRCPQCTDTHVVAKQVKDETGDIFGYRFDPQPEKVETEELFKHPWED